MLAGLLQVPTNSATFYYLVAGYFLTHKALEQDLEKRQGALEMKTY
jgi:hypothetical protein